MSCKIYMIEFFFKVKMSNIPPSYSDLGKSARDLLTKGYNYGLYKVEAKTKTSQGFELTTTCSSNHESKKFAGCLDTKYKWKDYGLTFVEKWNTDNLFASEITIEDQLINGLKLSFDTQLVPHTGKKSGKIKSEFQRPYVHTNLDVDFDFAGPMIHAAAVLGYKGWLAGYQMSVDTSKTAKSLLSQSNFAVGYSAGDITLHTAVVDGTEYQGSVHHKVSNRLETGVLLNWTAGSSDTRFSIGAKYSPDCKATLRARLNNASQIALSYQQKLRKGVTMTLSTQLEGKNLAQGGHKFGFGLDFEA
jgi:hypothetical protein